MSQKPQPKSGKRHQEIAFLEAELERAYQFIEQLRQQNAQLQNQVAYLEKRHTQEYTLLASNVYRTRAPNSPPRRKQGSATSRRSVSKSRGAKLSGLQFTAIALVLAAGFGTAGLALTHLIAGTSADSSFFPAPPPELHNEPDAPSVPPALPKADAQPSISPQPERENSELVYNLTTAPNFKQSENLQAIVDELVKMADNKGLPTDALSITLIDPRTNEIAGYKQEEPRYPASVVKMFWMVAVYAQIEKGTLPEAKFNEYIAKMIKESDNDAASFILDKITDTHSQPTLNDEEFNRWLNKREFVNRFFQNAGYSRININQKTFPVYSINLTEPRGTDLQMRGAANAPIRNEITSFHAARLLYEICGTGQAVSPLASQKMCEWLKRDLNPKVWKKEQPESEGFNPIRGLLGEALVDKDVQFYSKAGGTSTARLDAAFVTTNDGGTIYILVICANDRDYANDWQIFPEMSRLAFKRMTARSSY